MYFLHFFVITLNWYVNLNESVFISLFVDDQLTKGAELKVKWERKQKKR